tara:strand:+ start:69 stop:548 length:480 start_codon:yes stop_codon:yes gene_type:complete
MANNNSSETTSGMPQLNFDTFPNQIFWVVIFLILTYLMIKILIIPRMDNILTNRRKVIEEDLVGAESLKDKASDLKDTLNNEILLARKNSQEMLDNAKATAKNNLSLASNEANEMTNKLINDGDKALEKTRKDTEKIVNKISEDILPDIVNNFILSKNK